MAYIARFWLALDILVNVLLGGDVETLSSRMGKKLRQHQRCIPCSLVCWLLGRFWPDHCINNIMDPVNKQ